MSLYVLMAGLIGALLSGIWTALTLQGTFTDLWPVPWRGYVIYQALPAFLVGGLLVGLAVRGRWRAPVAFAGSAVLPGYWVPLLQVATQGISRPLDLFMAQFVLPMAAYLIMGTVGSLSAGLGWKRSLLVGVAFGAGVCLGPVAASLAGLQSFRGIVTISVGTPWITGTTLLAWFVGRRSTAPSH